MEENAFYAIGDPGRAALELPIGPPPTRVGRPDVEHSAASLPGMLTLGGTFRGLQHRARGTPCQDAFAIARRIEPGNEQQLIAVVCDGVGSLSRSDEAAVLVSRQLAVLCADGLPWPDAFTRANEELRKFAAEALGVDADIAAGDNGMATTAVAVIVHREADEWVGEAAWVGDSTLWHLTRDGQWALIAGPQ